MSQVSAPRDPLACRLSLNSLSFIHLPTLIWRFLTPASTFRISEPLLVPIWHSDFLIVSHGCCRHSWAVGRFSGAKSRSGTRNSANSRASSSWNLYLSTSNWSSDQNLSLRILFKSPYLSKKSFDRAPPVAICAPEIWWTRRNQIIKISLTAQTAC